MAAVSQVLGDKTHFALRKGVFEDLLRANFIVHA